MRAPCGAGQQYPAGNQCDTAQRRHRAQHSDATEHQGIVLFFYSAASRAYLLPLFSSLVIGHDLANVLDQVGFGNDLLIVGTAIIRKSPASARYARRRA
jgi:hypothetical protein